jgi:hypothetical protein
VYSASTFFISRNLKKNVLSNIKQLTVFLENDLCGFNTEGVIHYRACCLLHWYMCAHVPTPIFLARKFCSGIILEVWMTKVICSFVSLVATTKLVKNINLLNSHCVEVH